MSLMLLFITCTVLCLTDSIKINNACMYLYDINQHYMHMKKKIRLQSRYKDRELVFQKLFSNSCKLGLAIIMEVLK